VKEQFPWMRPPLLGDLIHMIGKRIYNRKFKKDGKSYAELVIE
jgi:hypothetical protein